MNLSEMSITGAPLALPHNIINKRNSLTKNREINIVTIKQKI